MARALLSVVTVLLLAAIAFLLFAKSGLVKKPEGFSELIGAERPPAPAPQPAPAPRFQSPPPSQPVLIQPPRTVPLEPVPVVVQPKGKRTHVVCKGETLSSIARTYYGSTDYYRRIAEANNLRSRDVIRIGQLLCIPELPGIAVRERVQETPQTLVERPAEKTPVPADETAAGNESNTDEFEPMPPTLSRRVPTLHQGGAETRKTDSGK